MLKEQLQTIQLGELLNKLVAVTEQAKQKVSNIEQPNLVSPKEMKPNNDEKGLIDGIVFDVCCVPTEKGFCMFETPNLIFTNINRGINAIDLDRIADLDIVETRYFLDLLDGLFDERIGTMLINLQREYIYNTLNLLEKYKCLSCSNIDESILIHEMKELLTMPNMITLKDDLEFSLKNNCKSELIELLTMRFALSIHKVIDFSIISEATPEIIVEFRKYLNKVIYDSTAVFNNELNNILFNEPYVEMFNCILNTNVKKNRIE